MKGNEIIKAVSTNKLLAICKNHESELLTITTIGASVGALVVMYRNAPEISDIIAMAKADLEVAEDKDERKDIYISAMKALAPLVAPIVVLEGGSIASTILNQKRTSAKIAQLGTALASYQIFSEEAKKVLSEEDREKVDSAVAKRELEENPATSKNTVKQGAFVNESFYYHDVFSSRYFYSSVSPDKVRSRVLDMAQDLYDGNCSGDKLDVNDIYEELFPDVKLTYKTGEDWGFLAEDATYGRRVSNLVDISVTPGEDENGKLCHVLDITARPLWRSRDRY